LTSGLHSLIERFQDKQIHAAHSGRELMEVLVGIVRDSTAASWEELDREVGTAIDELLEVMPAYAPPINVLHRFLTAVEKAQAEHESLADFRLQAEHQGLEYTAWSQRARGSISSIAYELVPEDSAVFTFTLSETVLTTLQRLWTEGKHFQVYVTESRPNNDGLDTAKHLSSIGIPVMVSIDACIPDLMSRSDVMLVGAEAILADGSAVCKAGTYLAALVAREHGVPLYILADTMKFDATSLRGVEHVLDPLVGQDFPEITNDNAVRVGGHLFDRTPPECIRGIVTELGLFSPVACVEAMIHMPISESLVEMLRAASHGVGNSTSS
jgi:translation initiation factor 2B subunit (eIF-2B alpha/beta/delta family)